MLRPVPCDWFEILLDRDDVATVLPVLAREPVIEMEREDLPRLPFTAETGHENAAKIAALIDLYQRYRAVLPPPLAGDRGVPPPEDGVPLIESALARWADYAHDRVVQLQRIDTELEELQWLQRCAVLAPARDLRRYVASPDAPVTPWIAHLPEPAPVGALASLPETLYETESEQDSDAQVVFAVSETPRLTEVERQLHTLNARMVTVPAWLQAQEGMALNVIARRCDDLQRERGQLRDQLDRRAWELELPQLTFLLQRYRWLQGLETSLWQGDQFSLVSGWVPRNRIARLRRGLAVSDRPYLLNLDSVHGRERAPVVLSNPAWARRFELFVRGFGVPARDEVDPSVPLALIMPLLFGFMFGDVGQGALLLLAGLFLRRRFPVMGLFVPAGAMAVLFGFLFGSVFANEHLFTPLWFHPLDDPMRVLMVPLVFGALLIVLSIAFAGLQAHWQGRAMRWWLGQFPVLPLAAGVVLLALHRNGGYTVVVAAALVVFTAAAVSGWHQRQLGGMLRELGAALPELLEALMQLLINTLSFARVGAFALAHAGLSSAIMALAALPASEPAQWAVIVAGNLLVVLLEGLIVSIQTTRLVMFEFFRRFVEGGGRPFRALAPGPVA
jgi:V/A-type H+-transporting ATPase subunit I